MFNLAIKMVPILIGFGFTKVADNDSLVYYCPTTTVTLTGLNNCTGCSMQRDWLFM